MSYQETIDYLFNALPAYQNQGKSAYKDNLDNTYALMEALNHPHQHFKSIHIAGTNGKGSVSHILAAIFQRCGYKTGLYTSPHLLDFRERIRINGAVISEEAVVNFTRENKALFEQIKPSFFEMTVALAFHTFREEKVDIAIVETGMGGRLDSTNVLQPEASVITNISRDHAQFLGDTLEKIAGEKAGIIKENTPVIVGESKPQVLPIFEQVAEAHKAPLHLAQETLKIVTQKTLPHTSTYTYNQAGKYFSIESDLQGQYQAQNIATALTTIAVLDQDKNFKLPRGKVLKALKQVASLTGLRGRWEQLQQNPLWIVDTGHNEAGIAFLMQQIAQLPQQNVWLIYGCVKDKELDHIMDLFDKKHHYIFTQSSNPRSMDSQVVYEKGRAKNLHCQHSSSVKEAIILAQKAAQKNDAVIICGSTFVVADALKEF